MYEMRLKATALVLQGLMLKYALQFRPVRPGHAARQGSHEAKNHDIYLNGVAAPIRNVPIEEEPGHKVDMNVRSLVAVFHGKGSTLS